MKRKFHATKFTHGKGTSWVPLSLRWTTAPLNYTKATAGLGARRLSDPTISASRVALSRLSNRDTTLQECGEAEVRSAHPDSARDLAGRQHGGAVRVITTTG